MSSSLMSLKCLADGMVGPDGEPSQGEIHVNAAQSQLLAEAGIKEMRPTGGGGHMVTGPDLCKAVERLTAQASKPSRQKSEESKPGK